MATRDALESSTALSQPVELYIFAIGGETFEFTSSEDDVTVLGTLYASEPGLSRSRAAQGVDERNRPLKLKMPASNPFAAKWKDKPPGLPGSVTILRVQRAETPAIGTTSALEFKGVVRTIDFPDDALEAVVAVSTIEGAANKPIPRYSGMAMCNHTLYGPGCDVDSNLHKVSAVVTVETATTITVPGVSAFPDGTFNGGYVKPSAVTDFRDIQTQVGDVLTLNLPFTQSVLDTLVDAFKGCDHHIDGDCDLVFDNVIEFGGWPFTPTKNPFQTGL